MRTLGLVRTVALFLMLFLASIVIAWALTFGMCSVVAIDSLCGHNGYIPLILFWIGTLVVLPMLWGWLKRTPPKAASAAKCSNCGAIVSLAVEQCPQCGFRFGSGANA